MKSAGDEPGLMKRASDRGRWGEFINGVDGAATTPAQ
jgi:hypothetical protein